jgi:sialate O-acetylesterase
MNLKHLLAVAGVGFALGACQQPQSKLQLPALFTNNMVLQQKAEVAIWGKATPGSDVKISADWGAVQDVEVNADSTWLIKLSTIESGVPHTLTIENADSTLTISNVLLGEVWLCSGQSNMEMPMAGWPPINPVEGGPEAIAQANFPDIRMFTVARSVSGIPVNDVKASWVACSPQSVPAFSATAFYFGRKLYNELKVPIGLINSCWGGTPIESWISGKVLVNDSDFVKTVKNLETIQPQVDAYNQWLAKQPTINVIVGADGIDPLVGLQLFDSIYANPAYNDDSWPVMTEAATIETTEIGEFDGVIWMRKVVEIPASWVGKELSISLGAIDDRDVTYFNGIKVGAHEESGKWQVKREYKVPAELVKGGRAVIAVRITDTQGGGGFTGTTEQMQLFPEGNIKSALSLAGNWTYLPVAEFKDDVLYIFDPQKNEFANRPKLSVVVGPYTATSLYNAMIAPLTPYTIKGSIWYQGEANVGRSAQYQRLMASLINNWRESFNNADMPFYYVQIAPWNYSDPKGVSSANLRDAQRRSMELPNTGMISTLDIGNNDDIHPANKKDVGERLAMWALANNYGKNIEFSGPLYQSFEVIGNQAIVAFTHADGLVMKPTAFEAFELSGADGVFYPATVTLYGNKVVLTSSKVGQPVNVRYAYHNSTQASLFNSAGLPAPSFSTEKELRD